MKGIDAIKARLEVLPCIIDPNNRQLEDCCPSGFEGTGIMDDLGHRIADAVLDQYADFIVNAPDDMRRLIARVEKLEAALEWYASTDRYKCRNIDDFIAGDFAQYDVLDDNGQRAHTALAEASAE